MAEKTTLKELIKVLSKLDALVGKDLTITTFAYSGSNEVVISFHDPTISMKVGSLSISNSGERIECNLNLIHANPKTDEIAQVVNEVNKRFNNI